MIRRTWKESVLAGPAVGGLAAASAVLIGKCWFDSPATMYTGVGLLILASVWNAVPRPLTASPCLACLPTDAGSTK